MGIHDEYRTAKELEGAGRTLDALAVLEAVAHDDDPFVPWVWYNIAVLADRAGDAGRFLDYSRRFSTSPATTDGGFRVAHVDLLVKRIVHLSLAGHDVQDEMDTLMRFEPSRYEVDPLYANHLQGLLPPMVSIGADETITAPWQPWTEYRQPIRAGAGHYAIDAPPHAVPAPALHICRSAQFVTNGRDNGVFRGDHCFDGLGTGPSVGRTLQVMRSVRGHPVRLPGRGLVLSDRFTGDNYCHWTMDWVPRILLARELGGGFDWLFVRASRTRFQLQWFEKLGIDPYKVIFEDGLGWYELDEVMYADNGMISVTHPAYGGHPEIIRRIRQAAGVERVSGAGSPSSGLKLFISRADGGGRGIINEAEVLAMLGRLGFQVVSLSQLSLDEQIALFAAADVVVGVHGAGLTNLVYLRPGAAVVELLHYRYGTKSYSLPALAGGLRYMYLSCGGHEGEDALQAADPCINAISFVMAPLWVDVDALARAVGVGHSV